MNLRQAPRRRRFALAAVCAATALIGASTDFAAAVAAQPTTHTVVIDGVRYEPAALTVKRGENVVWVNKDPFPHTVTAKGVFDSRDIAAGKSWKYTPRKAGRYDYVCTLHPNMNGTLTVE